MKTNKGFTLIEFLIVITICCVFGFGAYYYVAATTGEYTTEEIINPQRASARYQRELLEENRRIAEELEELKKQKSER